MAAILLEPDGVISILAETTTDWVLRALHRGRQFRTNREENVDQDQIREVLRIVLSRQVSNITKILPIRHDSIYSGRSLPCNPHGGTNTVTADVFVGTSASQSGAAQFSPWFLTDQSFDELQQEGSLLYTETREYMSISGDAGDSTAEMWEDFDWFAEE